MGAGPRGATAGSADSLPTRRAFFAGLALFRDVPGDVLDDVARVARPQRWSAGTLIFQRDDPSDMLICIQRGHLKISIRSADGREFTLQHLRDGAIVGEVGLLDASVRTADATAVTATSAQLIDRRDFDQLIDRHPALARAAIRHLCALVRYTTDHIETIALYSLEVRLARFLLSAVRQAEAGGAPDGMLSLDLSQSEIADLIGSSRPKVNRAIADLEAAGTVTREGRLIRCDVARLRRAARLGEGQI